MVQGQVHSYPSSWMQPCSPLSSTQASSQQEAHEGAPSQPCWLLGTSILGGAVAGDIFSPWHRWVSCLSELKERVVLPNLLEKFLFVLVGAGQCLSGVHKFLL